MSLVLTSLKLYKDQIAWLRARGNVSRQIRQFVRAAMDEDAANKDRSANLRANIAARKSLLADCAPSDTMRAEQLKRELVEQQRELDSREGR